jgi:hypothetical protein
LALERSSEIRVEENEDMRSRIIALLVAVSTIVAFAALALRPDHSAAQTLWGDADAEPAPFNPQMSALMNMLVQPRHAKLGIAGKAENWPLAGYMFKELRQSFAVTARAVPRWRGLPVPDLFEAAVTQPLIALDFAIKAAEPRLFVESFEKLTAGCNACHATTDHPFVVITVPNANAAFPNQDFQPKR